MNTIETTAVILAGLLANPAVVAANQSCGFSLVNSTDRQIVDYARHMAQLVADSEPCACADHGAQP